jgi:hypothetical protein
MKDRPEPRLVVLHSTLEGRVEEEKSGVTREKMKEMFHCRAVPAIFGPGGVRASDLQFHREPQKDIVMGLL